MRKLIGQRERIRSAKITHTEVYTYSTRSRLCLDVGLRLPPDGLLLLGTGVCLLSWWCEVQKMWWDSLTQVGSDGQHPARRTDQYPTAWETQTHTWTQTKPGSCRLTKIHASLSSRAQLEIAVTELNLLLHYGFIHYALLDSRLLIFFGSKLCK